MGGANRCSKCGHDYIDHIILTNSLLKEAEKVDDVIDEEMQAKFQQAENAEERAQLLYKKLENQK